MGERFDPSEWLERVFPKGIEKSGLLTDGLDIKKRYLKALVRATGISGRKITAEIYKTVDFYAEKEAALNAAGERAFKQEALNGQALLTSRLKNFLVYSEVQEQRKRHKGKLYRWLPSSAENPDPEHQLLYGKIFREGEGDEHNNMPGERWGCQCGIEWLADEDVMQYSDQEKKVFANTPRGVVDKVEAVYENAISRKFQNDNAIVSFGKLPSKTIKKIERKTGISFKGFDFKMDGESAFHAISRHGGHKAVEEGQTVINKKRLMLAPHIVWKFDNVVLENKKGGMCRLKFQKKIGHQFTEIVTVGKKKKHLLFKTFYGDK